MDARTYAASTAIRVTLACLLVFQAVLAGGLTVRMSLSKAGARTAGGPVICTADGPKSIVLASLPAGQAPGHSECPCPCATACNTCAGPAAAAPAALIGIVRPEPGILPGFDLAAAPASPNDHHRFRPRSPPAHSV